eukprot:285303-Chlamydomonas_euryale.AAC.3
MQGHAASKPEVALPLPPSLPYPFLRPAPNKHASFLLAERHTCEDCLRFSFPPPPLPTSPSQCEHASPTVRHVREDGRERCDDARVKWDQLQACARDVEEAADEPPPRALGVDKAEVHAELVALRAAAARGRRGRNGGGAVKGGGVKDGGVEGAAVVAAAAVVRLCVCGGVGGGDGGGGGGGGSGGGGVVVVGGGVVVVVLLVMVVAVETFVVVLMAVLLVVVVVMERGEGRISDAEDRCWRVRASQRACCKKDGSAGREGRGSWRPAGWHTHALRGRRGALTGCIGRGHFRSVGVGAARHLMMIARRSGRPAHGAVCSPAHGAICSPAHGAERIPISSPGSSPESSLQSSLVSSPESSLQSLLGSCRRVSCRARWESPGKLAAELAGELPGELAAELAGGLSEELTRELAG